jgi:hypothetical protein
MGQVNTAGAGYEFLELSAVGKRLVNEFQRHYSHLCLPSPDPSYRYIRRGSPEENVQLGRLIGQIRALDPETTSFVLQFAQRKANR